MLLAFVYSVLCPLLDVVDVRLRVYDPELGLLLLRQQLRVVPGEETAAGHGGPHDHGRAEPTGELRLWSGF